MYTPQEDAPKPAETAVVDGLQLLSMFRHAGAHLKYPKISLALATGIKLVIYLQGPRSNNAGGLAITDGGSYGAGKYYGKINSIGKIMFGRDADDTIHMVVHEICRTPVEALSVAGQQMGACCFCGKELQDHGSIAHGYGPTCANHFGLPWSSGKELRKHKISSEMQKLLEI